MTSLVPSSGRIQDIPVAKHCNWDKRKMPHPRIQVDEDGVQETDRSIER